MREPVTPVRGSSPGDRGLPEALTAGHARAQQHARLCAVDLRLRPVRVSARSGRRWCSRLRRRRRRRRAEVRVASASGPTRLRHSMLVPARSRHALIRSGCGWKSRGQTGANATGSAGSDGTIPSMQTARVSPSGGDFADITALGIPTPARSSLHGKEGVAGSSPAEGFVALKIAVGLRAGASPDEFLVGPAVLGLLSCDGSDAAQTASPSAAASWERDRMPSFA